MIKGVYKFFVEHDMYNIKHDAMEFDTAEPLTNVQRFILFKLTSNEWSGADDVLDYCQPYCLRDLRKTGSAQ
jgi:hypothetical protein